MKPDKCMRTWIRIQKSGLHATEYTPGQHNAIKGYALMVNLCSLGLRKTNFSSPK